MPPEIVSLINQIGFPGLVIAGMWYLLKHIEARNNEKDRLIYDILKEGQNRIEALVNMVLEISKQDAQNRAELKASLDMLIEQLTRMKDFCGKQN